MNRIVEDSRRDLISQSKRGDDYDIHNRQLGRNRHQRRLKSKFSHSTQEYNQIDMNKLFKDNIIDLNIRVNGETDVYLVQVSFTGFLNSLSGFLPNDAEEVDLNFRLVLRALLDAFNHGDIKVHCTCPDFQYRQAYWLTVNGNNAGPAETRPSDETNPDDTKGAGCKHINLVLNNTGWMMKVASVIFNYINYMKKHYAKLYANIIYPAIFEKEYSELDQEDNLDEIENQENDEMPSDEDTIDISNKWARTKNQFKPGNKEGIRFTKNDEDEPIIDNTQKTFDIDSIDNEDDEIEDN